MMGRYSGQQLPPTMRTSLLEMALRVTGPSGAAPLAPRTYLAVVEKSPEVPLGIESAREITNRDWMIGAALSSTFHGRDIFSPVGAHVARGDDWTQVGPEVPVDKLVRLDLKPSKFDEHGLSGEVLALDGPYGNLVTNISGDDFLKLGYERGKNVHITIGKTAVDLPFVRTFSDVARNKPLLYIDSRGHLGLAVNLGSFAAAYHIQTPEPIVISRPKQ